MPTSNPEIAEIVGVFVGRIVAAVEADAIQRVRGAVSAAFAGSTAYPKTASHEPRPPAAGSAAPKRKLNLSPAALAKRKLQGKYLGVIRPLQPAARERVKKVAREKGVAEAIKFAATLK